MTYRTYRSCSIDSLTALFSYAWQQSFSEKPKEMLGSTKAAWALLNANCDCFCTNENLGRGKQKEEDEMLWTIFVILLVLWLLGVVSSYTVGGFIHILLVLALVVLLINIIGGRRTVV